MVKKKTKKVNTKKVETKSIKDKIREVKDTISVSVEEIISTPIAETVKKIINKVTNNNVAIRMIANHPGYKKGDDYSLPNDVVKRIPRKKYKIIR